MMTLPMYRVLPFLLLCVWACGDDDTRGGPRDGGRDGGGTCVTTDDCDDGQACTIDSCAVGGVCAYEAIDERCATGEICDLVRGCTSEPSCASDADCDDGASCTSDRCGVGGECTNTPVDERCTGPGSTCDPATGEAPTGCTEAGCISDDDCDDTFECTTDRCGVDNECVFTPVNERCEEGEMCSTTLGCFAPMACERDADCQDGIFCNGAEVCADEFGCMPAAAPRVCDDSDPCTVDSCDATRDMCVFACDSSMSGCECPDAEVPCDGVFDVTPVPMQTCADLIGAAQVMYNVTEVEFACVGAVLQVDARNVPNPTGNSPLTQAPRPMDGSFDVSTIVAGGCEETYRLVGTFTDDDTFEAMFTAAYVNMSTSGFDECALSGCANQSRMVTGTRR